LKDGYLDDRLFSIILNELEAYPCFPVHNSLIYMQNLAKEEVICIPHNHELITIILDQAHQILSHFSDQRTVEYICCWYWW
ncbi:hypothetical protein BDQ17DRAFT_1168311, partial [Cyathus striatus]